MQKKTNLLKEHYKKNHAITSYKEYWRPSKEVFEILTALIGRKQLRALAKGYILMTKLVRVIARNITLRECALS